MFDKFMFCDALDLSALNSTGIIGSNFWDIEEDSSTTDGQLLGWINILITAAAAQSALGGTEGIWIELRCDDTANLAFTPASATADEQILGAIWLAKIQLVAGKIYSFGISRANLGKYVGIWARAHTTSVSGTLNIDAWFGQQPDGVLGIQKKPV